MSKNVGSIHYDLSIDKRKFDKDAADVDSKFDKLGSSAAALTKKIALVGAALTAVAGVMSYKAVKDSIDLSESINALEKTFGSAADKLKELGATADKQMGLSKAAFNSAAVPIGAMLQNMGLSADKAADETSKLLGVASDLASVFNTDLDQALTAIQAGLRGEADPLERFGVQMNQTTVKAYALRTGLIKQGEEMNSTALATARLGLFMEQTTKFQGDFVDTSDQAANRQRILEARMKNLSAEIGTKLLPVWERLLEGGEWFADNVLPRLSTGLDRLAIKYAEVLPHIKAFLENAKQIATQVWLFLEPSISALWNSISTKLIPALRELWEEVIKPLIPVLGTALVVATMLVIDAIKILVDVISFLARNFNELLPVLAGFGAMMLSWQVLGAIDKVRVAIIMQGGLKAALVNFAAYLKGATMANGALISPWGIFAAAAVIAFVKIQQEGKKTLAILDDTAQKVNASSASIDQGLRRAAQQFKEGKITKEQYNRLLNSAYGGARAMGGPVNASTPYLVGERGPELYIPSRSGRIVPNDETMNTLGKNIVNRYEGDRLTINANMSGIMARSASDLRDVFEEAIDLVNQSRRAQGKAVI